jgi:hypothetical protein
MGTHKEGEMKEMKYPEFCVWLEQECLHETIYKDSDGREILVIRLLDVWVLANKFAGTFNTGEKK